MAAARASNSPQKRRPKATAPAHTWQGHPYEGAALGPSWPPSRPTNAQLAACQLLSSRAGRGHCLLYIYDWALAFSASNTEMCNATQGQHSCQRAPAACLHTPMHPTPACPQPAVYEMWSLSVMLLAGTCPPNKLLSNTTSNSHPAAPRPCTPATDTLWQKNMARTQHKLTPAHPVQLLHGTHACKAPVVGHAPLQR